MAGKKTLNKKNVNYKRNIVRSWISLLKSNKQKSKQKLIFQKKPQNK